MSIRLIRRWLALMLVASSALGTAGAGGASDLHVILPPHNPAGNWPGGGIRSVTFLPLINDARRAQEGLGPLLFDVARYNRLSIPDQLFVISNLERVSRGEVPIYGLWSVLDNVAATGARLGTDPEPPPGWSSSFASIWGDVLPERTQVVLAADFEWMYEDGPPPLYGNSINTACLHAGEWGCWRHRDNILEQSVGNSVSRGTNVLLAGASGGVRNYHGIASLAMDFTWAPAVPRTGIVYTWARAVKYLGLPTSYVPTSTTTTSTTTTTTTTTTTLVTSTTFG